MYKRQIYAISSSWSISSSVRKSAFIESQAIGLFTDLGIAFENCICLEINVINNDIVKPISFKIAVVSVLTLGFIRILSIPVLSILSKDI